MKLVLDMIYVDWIVKKEKSTGILRRLSHALESLGFGAWQQKSNKPTGTSYELHKECEYILGKETQGIFDILFLEGDNKSKREDKE